jgi:hypothetical protein
VAELDVMALAAEQDLVTSTNTIGWVLEEIRQLAG